MFHYSDPTHPLKPYAYSLPGVLPAGAAMPANAHQQAPDFARMQGKEWAVENPDGPDWMYVPDHRKRKDERGREIEDSGTPYWLSDDTWQAPARYMKDLGPLPADALLAPPPKTQAEELAARKAAVETELALLDARSARPLRAVIAGTATDADRAMLAELEAQAVALRAEMAAWDTQAAHGDAVAQEDGAQAAVESPCA